MLHIILKDFKIKEYPLVITKSVPQKTFNAGLTKALRYVYVKINQ